MGRLVVRLFCRVKNNQLLSSGGHSLGGNLLFSHTLWDRSSTLCCNDTVVGKRVLMCEDTHELTELLDSISHKPIQHLNLGLQLGDSFVLLLTSRNVCAELLLCFIEAAQQAVLIGLRCLQLVCQILLCSCQCFK